MSQNIENSTFWVRCVGYTQSFERFFTIGKEYEVNDGYIINDNGHKYGRDHRMTINSDPSTWFLADWYEFEIVEAEVFTIPDHLEISIDDILLGITD